MTIKANKVNVAPSLWAEVQHLKQHMDKNNITTIQSVSELSNIFREQPFSIVSQDTSSQFSWLANIVDDDANPGVADTEISINDVNTLIRIIEKAETFHDSLKDTWDSASDVGDTNPVSRNDFQKLFPENPELKEGETAFTREEIDFLYNEVIGSDPRKKVDNKLLNALIEGNLQIVKGNQHGGYLSVNRSRTTLALRNERVQEAMRNKKEADQINQLLNAFIGEMKSKYQTNGEEGLYEKLSREEQEHYKRLLSKTIWGNEPTKTLRDIFYHEAYHAQVHQVNSAFPEKRAYSKSEELAAEAFAQVLSGGSYTSKDGLKDELMKHLQAKPYLYLIPENDNEDLTRNRLINGRFKPLMIPPPLLQRGNIPLIPIKPPTLDFRG